MSDIALVQIRLHDEEREALDRYRREQVNPPSRPQAVRELLRRALGHSDASGVEAHAP
jgi:hypothetical protein